ncbi:LysR family transcriptional regulator [Bradyrhizobium paxllaeri]|uniref:LysR family transcriptional regulator n=1 Tax=Bradyrhizobium paxllaeri TaxID=190148 RepID=UPI000AF8F01A|nr:LysR family transcriptional regulator [Bradyrhizobium paxllaeri]
MQAVPIIGFDGIKLVQIMQELSEHGSLEELTAFVAVGEAGNFAGAAKQIGRDASVISRRVSQLEQRLGVRLLSRTTRRVSLTEVGALYFRRVQALLGELVSATTEASDFAASPQGVLKISLPVTFGRHWIAPSFAPFLAQHPQIRIDAHFTDRIVDVVADGFDVAIRVGVLSDSSLTAKRMASYRNILIAAPSYLEAHGRPRTPADLKDHACLGFPSHPYWPDWMLTREGQRKTVRPNCNLVADNSEVIFMAALEGAGIALLPDWLVGPSVKARKLVQVLPGWTGRGEGGVYAVLPPGRLVPTKTRLFVDAISASIKAGWQRH